MERRIVISDSQVDDFAERMENEARKVCDGSGPPTKDKIKHCLHRVIEEIKDMRTRKRIERPEGSITIREASRKYGINSSTLTGWLNLGYLSPIKKTPKRTFLLESEVSYLAEVYKRAPGRGKRTIEQFYASLLD